VTARETKPLDLVSYRFERWDWTPRKVEGRWVGPTIEDPVEAQAWLRWDRMGLRKGPHAKFDAYACAGCGEVIRREDVLLIIWVGDQPFGHAVCAERAKA